MNPSQLLRNVRLCDQNDTGHISLNKLNNSYLNTIRILVMLKEIPNCIFTTKSENFHQLTEFFEKSHKCTNNNIALTQVTNF